MGGLSNLTKNYIMGKQVRQEREDAQKQNELMMGLMSGQQLSPEQITSMDPQRYMMGQQYVQQQQDRTAQQRQAQQEAADVLSDERDKKDIMGMVTTDYEGQNAILQARIDEITAAGGDPSDSQMLLDMPEDQRTKYLPMMAEQAGVSIGGTGDGFTLGKGQQRFDAKGNLIASGIEPEDSDTIGTAQREFESLTEGLTEEQKNEAILIKLGINPRAVSSADITIAESPELTEQIASSKAIIGERKKFGELTGASRSKAIDDGFEKIVKIDAAVGNIDKAIEALNSGAGVGAVERFIPSIKAASVELANIQKSMALDVIGAVTFGALSKGELDLAKEVALPTGLDSQQLIEHLQKRKVAQEKLRKYFNDQIQFLDQGGTIAGFLREKERGADVGSLSDEELFK